MILVSLNVLDERSVCILGKWLITSEVSSDPGTKYSW